MPDVRELTQIVANERLLQAGLMISQEEYQFDTTIPVDRVVSITPKPGSRVKRMSTVQVVLSKGDEQSAANNPDATPELRSTLVSVTLPNIGDEPQQARIDVTDDDGTRTVYQQEHQPGDKVIYTVQGTGDMTIEVYFGDEKILTKRY